MEAQAQAITVSFPWVGGRQGWSPASCRGGTLGGTEILGGSVFRPCDRCSGQSEGWAGAKGSGFESRFCQLSACEGLIPLGLSFPTYATGMSATPTLQGDCENCRS